MCYYGDARHWDAGAVSSVSIGRAHVLLTLDGAGGRRSREIPSINSIVIRDASQAFDCKKTRAVFPLIRALALVLRLDSDSR